MACVIFSIQGLAQVDTLKRVESLALGFEKLGQHVTGSYFLNKSLELGAPEFRIQPKLIQNYIATFQFEKLELPRQGIANTESRVPEMTYQAFLNPVFSYQPIYISGNKESLFQSLKLNPFDWESQYHLTLLEMKDGNSQNAIYFIFKFLRSGNPTADQFKHFGAYLLAQKNFEAAEAVFAAFSEKYPDNPTAPLGLAYVYEAWGLVPLALEIYNKLAETTDFEYFNHAQAKKISLLETFRRFDEAELGLSAWVQKDENRWPLIIRFYQQMAREYPDSTYFDFQAGLWFMEKRYHEAAIQSFEKVLQKNAGQREQINAAEKLMFLYESAKQYQKALEMAFLIEPWRPNNLDLQLKIAQFLGDTGNHLKSKLLLEKLYRSGKLDMYSMLDLAHYFLMDAAPHKTQKLLEETADWGPHENPRHLMLKALLAYKTGDSDQAFKLITSYLNDSPEDAKGYYLAGLALISGGYFNRSLEWFREAYRKGLKSEKLYQLDPRLGPLQIFLGTGDLMTILKK